MFSNIENEFELFKKDYDENKFDVYIYGAGRGSYWAIKLLNKYNIPVKFIIDKNIKDKNIHFGIPIISIEDMLELNKENKFKILIASPRFEVEIRNELEKYIEKNRIYSFECELYYSSILNINEYKNYLDTNIDNLKEIYNNLEDDLSKKTLKNILLGRVSGNLKYFNEVCMPNQYFCEDIIKFSKEEVILDLGANYGDTLEEILKRTDKRFKKIYCFELDEKCIASLENLKKDLQLNNLEIINKGAWHKRDILTFSSNPTQGASRIIDCKNGKFENDEIYTVNTIDIDSVVCEDVTFIKMDIEGAELNALKGAKEVIKKNKPKLAICVYHKNEDIIDIYDYITKLVPEYKVYLRHHNVSGTETVLYAVI